ncbi:vomeronasal type-1 receptor 1-like [Gracilinanus agilis]|uniref:vomeronasal type-1 receptor 1-like n=1 Tax=Gracilinanus agilis TaxID=191870 RepID=UPI001CFF454B|nr:vomeronasal type-1 receptor 1-like [Gracilinanus agilis]
MNPQEILLSIVFCFQTLLGMLGNSFLICLFILVFLTGHTLRPIDPILTQLAFANSLVLLCKGIPQTMAALGLKNFLDDGGCKTVFYLHRVARGLSLSMTCLLSGFQAITISPRVSRWAELKARIPKYITATCVSCWTFYLLFCITVIENIKGPGSSRNSSDTHQYEYCFASVKTKEYRILSTFIFSLPDAMCVSFLVLASGYMVLLLSRHQKQVQHIHKTSHSSSRVSHEIRATQAILLQASAFVCFYSLNSILVAYMHSRNPILGLVQCSAFLASCFPTVSPFLLICTDSQVLRYYGGLWPRNVALFNLSVCPSWA